MWLYLLFLSFFFFSNQLSLQKNSVVEQGCHHKASVKRKMVRWHKDRGRVQPGSDRGPKLSLPPRPQTQLPLCCCMGLPRCRSVQKSSAVNYQRQAHLQSPQQKADRGEANTHSSPYHVVQFSLCESGAVAVCRSVTRTYFCAQALVNGVIFAFAKPTFQAFHMCENRRKVCPHQTFASTPQL